MQQGINGKIRTWEEEAVYVQRHKIREIGIMKAIGARNSFVLNVILTESLIFGITGVILGSLMGLSITKYWEIHPIALSTAESSVISASFSFASRINIIKAIWHG